MTILAWAVVIFFVWAVVSNKNKIPFGYRHRRDRCYHGGCEACDPE